jgi:hypothetical protein
MKTIFAKYNRERLPKYQIVTKIVVDEDGTKYALKEALCDEAKDHIENIYTNYELLKSSYDINLVKPTKLEKGLLFEMAEGKSLENILLESLDKNDEKEFNKYIDKFFSFLDGMVSRRNVEFIPSKEFEAIFGKWETTENEDIIELANVDLIFGNIFVNEKDEFSLIDYEWVFDFEIPKSYVIWRSLVIFSNYHSVNIDNKYINSIIDQNNEDFLKLDNYFSGFVHGKDKKYFLSSKVRKVVDFINLEKKETTINSDYFIQLFIGDENFFTEENSKKYPIMQNNEIQKFEFDLKNKKDIKSLRLDPLNDSCVIEIEKLYLLQKDGKEIDLISLISSNVSSIQDKNYFFETFDPQIYVENLGLEVLKFSDKLYIELKYTHILKDAVHVCANQIVREKNYKISILEKEKSVIQESLFYYQNKITTLESELISIYTSKSWKITRPLRNIVRIIKNLNKR